jgi:hypothetical protein
MSLESLHPKNEHPTRQADSRYSLVHSGVIIRDQFVFEAAGGLPRRFVTYSTPNSAAAAYRDSLEAGGVILGAHHESSGGDTTYVIPPESRPLSLEATTGTEETYPLSDAALMEDLGRIVRTVHRLCAGQILGGPFIEQAFALRDFIQDGHPRLFVSPGIEHHLVPVPETEDALALQVEAFSPQFRDRYSEHGDRFLKGYAAAQEE